MSDIKKFTVLGGSSIASPTLIQELLKRAQDLDPHEVPEWIRGDVCETQYAIQAD